MVADTRAKFEEHLLAALDEAESGEATYHIREGLQLAECEGRRVASDETTVDRRREGRTDHSRGPARRSLARLFDSRPLNDEG